MDLNNNIDWDKLVDAIERGEPLPSQLSDDEYSTLAMLKEMRTELMMSKFPADEGWERFEQARLKRKRRKLIIQRWVAAASIIVLMGVTGFWWFLNGKDADSIGDIVLTEGIKIKRSNGVVIDLGNGSNFLEDNGIQIRANSKTVIYHSKGGQGITQVLWDTLEVPRGKTYGLQLPDGTSVTLNADSKLIFPEAFGSRTREVYIQGEAFFDVKHDDDIPFIVHTGRADLKVLGTAFDVNTYGSEQTSTLVRGKLQVIGDNNSVVLLPGEQSILEHGGTLHKQKVDTRLYTAWVSGDIFFDNASLEEITTVLSRTFGCEFSFQESGVKDIRLTIDMSKPDSIVDVLRQIQNTGVDVDFKVMDNRVKIEKKK